MSDPFSMKKRPSGLGRGLLVVDTRTGDTVRIEGAVRELIDVTVLSGVSKPGCHRLHDR